MNKILKDKTIWFYMELAAAVLVVVALVIGWTTKGLVKNTFNASIIVCGVIGILLEVLYVSVKLEISVIRRRNITGPLRSGRRSKYLIYRF